MAAAAAGCVLNDCGLGAAAAAALGSLPAQPAGMPSAMGPPGARLLLPFRCKQVRYRVCCTLHPV
jgi:hypothetical protein